MSEEKNTWTLAEGEARAEEVARAFAKKYAERLRNIKINWTDKHTTKVDKLFNEAAKKPAIAAENLEQEYSRFIPSFWHGDLNTLFLGCLQVMECFGEEWAHVLTDSGDQTSLFHGQELTDKQRKAWSNYYEMDPDARRLFFLWTANYICFLQEITENNKAQENKENIITHAPTEYLWPLSKAARFAFGPDSHELSTQPLRLEPRGAKKKISLSANIWAIDENGKTTKTDVLNSINSLTLFDKAIHNAIGILFCSGNRLITPQMINNILNANSRTYLSTDDQRYEDIISSVKKLFRHRIVLDTTDEDKNGWKKYCNLIPRRYDSALVSGKFVEYGEKKINGYEVKSYFEIFETPPLYEYSSDINQITIFKSTLMELPNKSFTDEAIIVRNEVIEHLRIMQNAHRRGQKRVSHRILLAPIYQLIGITEGNEPTVRKRRAYARGIVEDVLANWRKEKEIKDYKKAMGKRGAIIAYDIIL